MHCGRVRYPRKMLWRSYRHTVAPAARLSCREYWQCPFTVYCNSSWLFRVRPNLAQTGRLLIDNTMQQYRTGLHRSAPRLLPVIFLVQRNDTLSGVVSRSRMAAEDVCTARFSFFTGIACRATSAYAGAWEYCSRMVAERRSSLSRRLTPAFVASYAVDMKKS